ncbi:4-hydroxy-tetrahydrodipicolinate synthase [Paracidovorax avenae]|uniref:4-hydroxy-tetrahydrodipicolinate synthase n=1 Tax=Paracidovorax avenae TaxID=80867 RepID=UPI000D15342A|nr:4-hydroxy-tetrahydrodipicolinate synthase [Paracidovorax avenae]AVS77301.1 4-hydroxy-tetrahydrodipicolinate synthase [Paracidovorax avenae]AVS80518.1 4-hydroxy-tetrahydrodipicolinate synthase [Paracidovorax avenae]AVT15750.1 4-hydroxy-tetrahydrodipicolinate synthase [Paracidovorax avenae]
MPRPQRARGDFSGLWVPLVTPFSPPGDAVDHAGLSAMVRRLAGEGIAGFVACGSTGEAAALDGPEQDAVLATILDAAGGLPVVMGLSGHHLDHAVQRARRLGALPLAGLLVPAPHYIRPSQPGLLQWFHAIADASAVPLIVYDIPYRTGATLELGTLRTLAAHPNIRALKDCGGNASKTQALIADGALQVLAGEDIHLFTTAALGGAGAIAASAHWQPARLVQCLEAIERGDLGRARELWRALLPLIEAFFAEPNPAPVKALLAAEGWMDGTLRAPMAPASAALSLRLQEAARAQARRLQALDQAMA